MNYILSFPCPHCGGDRTLTYRSEKGIEPVIPLAFQAKFAEPEVYDDDFSFSAQRAVLCGEKPEVLKPILDSIPEAPPDQDHAYRTPTNLKPILDSIPEAPPDQDHAYRTPLRVGQNLPLERIFPPALQDINLSATEQNLYLQLSIEYHIVMDKAPSYQKGVYRWNQLLPERLQNYGLTLDGWERIVSLGDNNDLLQEQFDKLVKKMFPEEE
jgi:hypothetical protein